MKPSPLRKYTCADYREEMRLLGLRRRLERDDLSEEERERLRTEVEAIEQSLSLN